MSKKQKQDRWEEVLKEQKHERWEEVVNSNDFFHSSRKAWSTINKLTGRSGRSSRLCPVSPNSIASQLVKNGAHRTGGREHTSFISKQMWKIPRVILSLEDPEGHIISELFRPVELATLAAASPPGCESTGGRESTRFVKKPLSDLWMIPTPEGHSTLGRRSLLLPSDA